jgi:hypothetical protein
LGNGGFQLGQERPQEIRDTCSILRLPPGISVCPPGLIVESS